MELRAALTCRARGRRFRFPPGQARSGSPATRCVPRAARLSSVYGEFPTDALAGRRCARRIAGDEAAGRQFHGSETGSRLFSSADATLHYRQPAARRRGDGSRAICLQPGAELPAAAGANPRGAAQPASRLKKAAKEAAVEQAQVVREIQGCRERTSGFAPIPHLPRCLALLDEVDDHGDTITVTKRVRPVAALQPVKRTSKRA